MRECYDRNVYILMNYETLFSVIPVKTGIQTCPRVSGDDKGEDSFVIHKYIKKVPTRFNSPLE